MASVMSSSIRVWVVGKLAVGLLVPVFLRGRRRGRKNGFLA